MRPAASNPATLSRNAGARARVRRALAAPATWAMADQGVLSFGNFLTHLTLANALPARDYGTFALVYGLTLFLNSLHGAVVTYPLSVRGAVADPARLRQLAGTALLFTGLLAPAGALLLTAGLALIGLRDGWASLGIVPWAAGAMVVWQAQETMRRSIMARLDHRRALPGDALGYLGQAAALLALLSLGALSLRTAFAAVACTSSLAALVQACQVRPSFAAAAAAPALARDFWRLGRWVLLTCGLGLVTIHAMPWTLFFFHGPAQVANFQALANVLAVGNPVVTGMGNVIVPAVARSSPQGASAALRVALRYGALGAVLLAPLYGVLILAPGAVLSALYRGATDYDELGLYLRLFAVAYMLVFPAQLATGLLFGLGRSRRAFWAQGAFAAAVLAVSLPAAAAFGLRGAVWAGLLPPLAYLAASYSHIKRWYVNAAGPGGAEAPDAARRPAPDEELQPPPGAVLAAAAEGVSLP